MVLLSCEGGKGVGQIGVYNNTIGFDRVTPKLKVRSLCSVVLLLEGCIQRSRLILGITTRIWYWPKSELSLGSPSNLACLSFVLTLEDGGGPSNQPGFTRIY